MMDELKVIFPPKRILENALGYRGDARYLSAWWEPAGDELMLSDGRVTYCGDWWSYLQFVDANAAAVYPYSLGGIEEQATHRLLLDLEERRCYAGESREIERFVQDQWPWSRKPAAVVHMTSEQLEEIVQRLQEDFQQVRHGRARDVNEALVQAQLSYARLVEWLEEHRGVWAVEWMVEEKIFHLSQFPQQAVGTGCELTNRITTWPETFATWEDAMRKAMQLNRNRPVHWYGLGHFTAPVRSTRRVEDENDRNH